MAQCRWTGTPTIHGAPTNRMRELPGTPQVRRSGLGRIRTLHSTVYSSARSLCLAALLAHHSDEQIGDAWTADLTQPRKFLAIHTIEQQNASTEHLALVHRLERPRSGGLLRMHHHLQIAQLKIVHAALEHDAPAVHEYEIGEHVLDLFHLMRRHHDRTASIEVVVQQGIIKLLAIQDVEA